MKLDKDFYLRNNVLAVAKELLGKVIICKEGRKIASGMVVETEAYSFKERGCHAYQNKRTARNATMFNEGGHAYVYLCYGMHHLFNIVTNREGYAEAVLIRAIEPLEGIEWMMARRGMERLKPTLTSGPGKLTQAIGINKKHNGLDLTGKQLWLEDRGILHKKSQIETSARIGIDYAGADALLPWRFTVKDSIWLSK